MCITITEFCNCGLPARVAAQRACRNREDVQILSECIALGLLQVTVELIRAIDEAEQLCQELTQNIEGPNTECAYCIAEAERKEVDDSMEIDSDEAESE